MKNFIIIVCVWFAAMSCAPPPPDTSAFDEGIAKFEKNKETADRTYDLFISGKKVP